MTTETIDHTSLSHLVEAGAVRAAQVIGQAGGWAIVIKYGMNERPLAAQRSGQVRLFKKLETLVSYLKDLGINRFDVDAGQYDPASLKTHSRPDRSQALKEAHQAAAYERWFRDQVQASIDDPRPSIPHDQVKAEFAARRAKLAKTTNK